ncbi:MAG: hypothetical protein SGI88_13635 [Candidatus Hydrogenedentes bacterium]|nr:hypothetical protein [Candidatus Hydrogenedentota bacterium]
MTQDDVFWRSFAPMTIRRLTRNRPLDPIPDSAHGLAATWFLEPEQPEKEDLLEAMAKRLERMEAMIAELSAGRQ